MSWGASLCQSPTPFRQAPEKPPDIGRSWKKHLKNHRTSEVHGKKEQNNGTTTLFPLHSLRVSLITALALEGLVPFPLLQKLVGHSRLLMEYTLALVTLIGMIRQELTQRKLAWWNATHTSHS